MRQFVVIGHDVPTTAEFSLDDLPGGAGRLDVLCRCLNSAFVLSHGLREDVRAHLVFSDTVTITFDGSSLRRFNPDERSTAALLRGALERRDEAIGALGVESSPGVTLVRRGVTETIEAVAEEGTLVQLHEEGTPVVEVEPPADPVFVLSDHRDFEADEAALIEERADCRLRVGPERLHADHAITVAQNWLDTRGYERY